MVRLHASNRMTLFRGSLFVPAELADKKWDMLWQGYIGLYSCWIKQLLFLHFDPINRKVTYNVVRNNEIFDLTITL